MDRKNQLKEQEKTHNDSKLTDKKDQASTHLILKKLDKTPKEVLMDLLPTNTTEISIENQLTSLINTIDKQGHNTSFDKKLNLLLSASDSGKQY